MFVYWWLVELPMWLTDGFSVTFFGRWRGAVRIHMSHIQLPYTVINMHVNMQGRGGNELNIEKLGNFGNLQITIKVAGSIGSHIGSSTWQPS